MGTELVRRLIEVARDEKLEQIVAVILPENYGMMALARHFQFTVRRTRGSNRDYRSARSFIRSRIERYDTKR